MLHIYQFDRQYDQAQRVLLASSISERNKALVRQFCESAAAPALPRWGKLQGSMQRGRPQHKL
jgi:hypothetical protein